MKDVKTLIKYFYQHKGIDAALLQVHLIEITYFNSLISIELFSSRPGFLIGKAGVLIDGLKDFLEEELSKKIEIKITEFDPFK